MHKLATTPISLDASVALDFHLTGSVAVLEELFDQRILLSDFVRSELPDTMQILGATIVPLSVEAEWELFNRMKKERRALGVGEIGAIVVAHTRNSLLLTNDKPARIVAEQLGLTVPGSIGVLEYAVETGRLPGRSAGELLDEMVAQGARIAQNMITDFKTRVDQNVRAAARVQAPLAGVPSEISME